MPTSTLEELAEEIKDLKLKISEFEKKERDIIKNDFENKYRILRDNINRTEEIENKIEKLQEDLDIFDIIGDMIMINNPYSNQLGFKFAEVIEKNVEQILFKEISVDNPEDENNKKNRFLRIVKKIINNPIADAIIDSNPVTSIVGNIIGTVSNLIDTKVEAVERSSIGKAIKKVKTVTKDEIKIERLTEFRESMQKYSDFYSKMLDATRKFDIQIDLLKASYSKFYVTNGDIHRDYLRILKFDIEKNPYEELDQLFQKYENPENSSLTEIIEKEEIRNSLDYIKNVSEIELESEKFSDEFANIMDKFIGGYISALNIPLDQNWSSEEIDLNRLKKKIEKFEKYLNKNIDKKKIEIGKNGKIVSKVSFAPQLVPFSQIA